MSNSRLLIGVLFYLLPHCLACPSTDDTFIFLQAIYNRTNPNLWTTNNWFAGTDCCTWHGVTCNGAMGINSLDLHNNNLSGDVSMILASATFGFAYVPYLTTLNLADNPNLHGTFPLLFGSNYVRLQSLSLSRTKLSGSLINFGTSWLALSTLLMSNMLLSGPIPDSFGNSWSSLRFIDLSSNALTGTLSPTFGSQWNNLLQINLSDNQFVGAVPTTFGVGWQYLQSLNLGGSNSFSNATFSFGPSQWLNTLTTCVIDTVVFTCPLPEWTSNQACANSVSNMQCMVTPAPTAPTLNSVGQLLTFKLLISAPTALALSFQVYFLQSIAGVLLNAGQNVQYSQLQITDISNGPSAGTSFITLLLKPPTWTGYPTAFALGSVLIAQCLTPSSMLLSIIPSIDSSYVPNTQLAIRCPDGVFRANNCVIDTPPGLSSTIVAVLISLSAVLLFAIFAVCWFYRRASSAIAPMDLEMQDTQPPRRSTTVLANSLFRELPPDATTPSTPSMRVPIPVPEYQALQSPITTSPITRESTAIHNNSERATHLNEPAHMGSRLKSSIIVNR